MSTTEPNNNDGRTYSWGLAGARSEWPAKDPKTAHEWARHMSTDGRARTVHEYPPGPPQPGRLIATYLNGKEQERATPARLQGRAGRN